MGWPIVQKVQQVATKLAKHSLVKLHGNYIDQGGIGVSAY